MKNLLKLGFLLSFHLFFLLFTQFTAWPEMLMYPYLMENGFRLYGDIIHPYLPMLPWVLQLIFRIFGLSVETLRWFTIFVILVTDAFLYYLLLQKVKQRWFWFLLLYIPLQLIFGGNGMWFDLFSIPFILITYGLLVQKKLSTQHVVYAAISLGIAVLIKQTNILFLLPTVFALKRKVRDILLFVLTGLVPLVAVIIYYSMQNNFTDFLYWSLYHPLFVMSRIPGFVLLPTKRELVTALFIFSPLALVFYKKLEMRWWVLFSLIFVFPRFALFHLQPALPFLVLGLAEISKSDQQISQWFRKYIPTIYLCFIALLCGFFLSKNWTKPVRFFGPEVIKIRQELIQTMPQNEPVFFLNVPSQYFIGMGILPPKPWADTFPWYLEVAGMQERLMNELDRQQVRWVVQGEFSETGEYELGSYKPALLHSYIESNYTSVFTIDHMQVLQKK